jgi:hypothetical protein
MLNHNLTEKTVGEKKAGKLTSLIFFNTLNIICIHIFSHYSVKSHISVSFVPGLEKISLGVISLKEVKAFKNSSMHIQLLHNQKRNIGIWHLLVKD